MALAFAASPIVQSWIPKQSRPKASKFSFEQMRDRSRDRFVWLGELLACLDKEAGEEALFFGGGVGPFLGKLAEATNGVMTIADHEGGESPIYADPVLNRLLLAERLARRSNSVSAFAAWP